MSDGSRAASIDDLIDSALAALNRGDRVAAQKMADRVLSVDSGNTDAADLLSAPAHGGEIRRLTIMFADLVDSTALSTQVEPETYRVLVGRFREQVQQTVQRHEGHIAFIKGDGLLALFGHPVAHDDDVRRAVAAGLDIAAAVESLNRRAQARFGVGVAVRVGVHRGVVYLDTTQDDVYGLAANLAARVSGLAPANGVVVSATVEPLIHNVFELQARPPTRVKGFPDEIVCHVVLGERPTPVRAQHGPLVGRDTEVRNLRERWTQAAQATSTKPGIAFRGDAGIGKSRLAVEAADLAQGSDALILELTGSPLHARSGLHPVRGLLQQRCGVDRGTPARQRIQLLEEHISASGLEVESLVPLLAPVIGVGTDSGYEPVAAEGRRLLELITEGLVEYLRAAVANGPVVLIAEDMHWFDPSTLDIVGALLRNAPPTLLVVMTGRQGPWLRDDWPVDVFDLAPLSAEDADTLIAALNPDLAPSERDTVARRCDGVPFYIEQVVHGHSESGVPEALYEPLFARLRAAPDAVPVVEAAAVIGRQVDGDLLRRVVNVGADVIDRVTSDLLAALVFERSGPDRWRFRHELLREVAAEMAPPSIRRRLHAAVADALASGAEPDWHVIASHYHEAQRHIDAVTAYEHAADEACRRGALTEAVNYLTEAITQIALAAPGPLRDRREMVLRLQRGCLPKTVEDVQSGIAETDFERCLQLGGGQLADDELAATLTALVVYFTSRADLRRATQVFDSVGAGKAPAQDSLTRVIEGAAGVVSWVRGEFALAHTQLSDATSGAFPDDPGIDKLWFMPNDPWALAHQHLALTSLMQGDVHGAEAELARAVEWLQQLPFPRGPYGLGYAGFVESWICLETGRLDRAVVRTTEVVELGQRHGFDAWLLIGATQRASATAHVTLAATTPVDADVTAHIATLTALLDAWRALGFIIYSTAFDAILARLLIAAGEPERARARLDIGLSIGAETGMRFYDAELLRLRARTHDEPDARLADLAAARAVADSQGAWLFALRAAIDEYTIRGTDAEPALVEAISRIPGGSPLPELTLASDLLRG